MRENDNINLPESKFMPLISTVGGTDSAVERIGTYLQSVEISGMNLLLQPLICCHKSRNVILNDIF